MEKSSCVVDFVIELVEDLRSSLNVRGFSHGICGLSSPSSSLGLFLKSCRSLDFNVLLFECLYPLGNQPFLLFMVYVFYMSMSMIEKCW